MKTILIADDNPTEIQLMSRVVSDLGHSVIVADDGDTCVTTAKAKKPDLILLDVVMPRQDGFATCRKLKMDPDTAQIPVIMVTTKDQETDKFWAAKQGANGYVTKPFTPELLANAIRSNLKP